MMCVGRSWSQLFPIRSREGRRKVIRGGSSWRHTRMCLSMAVDGANCQRHSRRGIRCTNGSGSGERRKCWSRSGLFSALSHSSRSMPKVAGNMNKYNCSTRAKRRRPSRSQGARAIGLLLGRRCNGRAKLLEMTKHIHNNIGLHHLPIFEAVVDKSLVGPLFAGWGHTLEFAGVTTMCSDSSGSRASELLGHVD